MSKLCPNCGYQNEESAKFCLSCGARLDCTASEPTAMPVDRQTQQEFQTDDPYRYYPGYQPPQPTSKKTIAKVIGIVIGVFVLIFILLTVFVVFIMPNMIVDKNYQRPTESYPEGYHPHADYYDLDLSTLDYGDENTMKDFSYTDGWITMSSSAQRVTGFESTLGFWKAVMITDPENKTEEGTSYDYFNVEISGMAEDTYIVVNWNRRVIEKTGEEQDIKGGRAGLSGKFTNGSVTAENGNKIEMTDFWTDGNTDYAVGKFTWLNGSTGYIGLIRQK